MQIAPGNTGAIGRDHCTGAAAGFAGQEIAYTLGGSMIIAATGAVRCFLDGLLPVHTRQSTLATRIVPRGTFGQRTKKNAPRGKAKGAMKGIYKVGGSKQRRTPLPDSNDQNRPAEH